MKNHTRSSIAVLLCLAIFLSVAPKGDAAGGQTLVPPPPPSTPSKPIGKKAKYTSDNSGIPTPLPPIIRMPEQSAPTPGSIPDTSDSDLEVNRYVLGRSDQISVTDYTGQTSSTQSVIILPDGTVSIYPIGSISAAGKTLAELTKDVNERAQKYLVNPQFLVTLTRARPVTVYVLGDVQTPGLFNLSAPAPGSNSSEPTQTQMPSLNALQRDALPVPSLPEITQQQPYIPETPTVLAALERAGGLKESANVRQIKVTRAHSKEILYVDLWKLLVDGDYSQDVELEPRDIIFVARGGSNFNPSALGKLAAQQTRSVRIWGAVKNPGLYQLGPNDDLMSVIAKSGGFSPNAFRGSVMLSRVDRDGTVRKQRVSIGAGMRNRDSVARAPIQSGDVIIASYNPLAQMAHPLLITGLTIAAAMVLIYFSNRIPNINVNNNTNGTGTNSSNVRVAVPIF